MFAFTCVLCSALCANLLVRGSDITTGLELSSTASSKEIDDIDDRAMGPRTTITLKCTNGATTTHSIRNNQEVIWVNPKYPHSDVGPLNCSLVIRRQKKWPETCQLRVEFEQFSLAQPTAGVCLVDKYTVDTGQWDSDKAARCGQEEDDYLVRENGQKDIQFYHRYHEFGENSDEISFLITTSAAPTTRTWKLRIRALSCKDFDAAPRGCHRYFHDKTKNFILRSVNYPHSLVNGYLANNTLTICFGTSNASDPLYYMTMKADAGPFNAKAFQMGAQKGAMHDGQCKFDETRVPMPFGPGPQELAYCGDVFSSKKNKSKKKNEMIRIEVLSFYRLRITSGADPKNSGYRFIFRLNEKCSIKIE